MDDSKIAIIGLGYVGLPLSIEFGKVFETIGFDTKQSRVADLKRGHDSSFEVTSEKFKESEKLTFTNDVNDIEEKAFDGIFDVFVRKNYIS